MLQLWVPGGSLNRREASMDLVPWRVGQRDDVVFEAKIPFGVAVC